MFLQGPINLVSLCVAWLGKRLLGIFSLESLTEENITHVYLTRPVAQVLVEVLYCSRIFSLAASQGAGKFETESAGNHMCVTICSPKKDFKSVLTV